MPYITSVERIGRQEGLREGLLEGIALGLEIRFGSDGLLLVPEVHAIQDIEKLRALQQAIKTAASADELRRIWA